MDELIRFLKGRAARVRQLEAQAGEALNKKGDEPLYRDLMKEKAGLLADLSDDCEQFLETLDEGRALKIRPNLNKFSKSAASALKLGSVFYMSALLYPEDYIPGRRNDLEAFIYDLEAG